MDVITWEAYDRHWQDCLKANGTVASNTDGFDRIGYCQNRYSNDYFWSVQLQSGLHLDWVDDDYHQDLRIRAKHPEGMPFVAKFYLSGRQGVHCPGIPGVPAEYSEAAGQSYFFALPDIEEDEINLVHERVQLIRLHIEPNFFQTFGIDLTSLPEFLQQTLIGQRKRFHQSLGKMSPPMHAVLQQILHCPYRHETKQLFLEGKALELVALQIDQWVALEQGERPSQGLKAADTERVYEAANILLRELVNPPSIVTLAHRVSLNEHKLKVGFRQMFETTVFGYVRAQRLEQARQLLVAGDITVTQAALSVGYASQGHFAAAFRKRFGVNPRSLRQ